MVGSVLAAALVWIPGAAPAQDVERTISADSFGRVAAAVGTHEARSAPGAGVPVARSVEARALPVAEPAAGVLPQDTAPAEPVGTATAAPVVSAAAAPVATAADDGAGAAGEAQPVAASPATDEAAAHATPPVAAEPSTAAPVAPVTVSEPQPQTEPAAAEVAAALVTGSAATSAAATGVADGTVLSPMAGGTVTAANTVIENKVITGDVLFTGSGLTLRNVRVTGEVIFRGDNLSLTNLEVGALSLSGTAGVAARAIEVTGSTGRDGIHITSDSGQASNVLLEDVWVHNPLVTATSHYDGLQVRGVERLTLRRVHIDLGAFAPQHNAALFLENANGGNRDITVESSWLRGGGYVTYVFGSDVKFVGTTFSGGNWGNLFPASPATGFSRFDGNVDSAGQLLRVASTNGTTSFVADAGGTGELTFSCPAI